MGCDENCRDCDCEEPMFPRDVREVGHPLEYDNDLLRAQIEEWRKKVEQQLAGQREYPSQEQVDAARHEIAKGIETVVVEEEPRYPAPVIEPALLPYVDNAAQEMDPLDDEDEVEALDYGTILYYGSVEGKDPELLKPTKATAGSLGYDVRAREYGAIEPGRCALFKTGVRGHFGFMEGVMVLSKSGLALKKQVFVLNAPGLVDSDFADDAGEIMEIGVILQNAGTERVSFAVGDKIAQLLPTAGTHIEAVLPYPEEGVFIDSERTGGFGSTGAR